MKKYLLLLLFMALIILQNTNAQTPVAYYPFNGNANDIAGTLNGTVNGATLTTDRFGNPNSAYSFDGVDDIINFTTLASTQVNNFTVSAWVKPNTLSQFACIVYNGFDHVGNGAGNGWGLLQRSTSTNSSPGDYLSGHYPFSAYLNIGQSITTANVWVHIALVRDNGVTKFYLNGISNGLTASETPLTPTGSLTIGASNPGNSFFNGSIDEVKVFNTALTAAQVQAEFASTNQVLKPGSGNAISFDGVDDVIDIPNNNAINFSLNQNFTVECWAKIPSAIQPNESTESANSLIEKWNGVTGGYPYVIRYRNNNAANVPSIRTKIEVARWNGANYVPFYSNMSVNDDKFHHISVTKNSSTLSLYIDGVFQSSATDLISGTTENPDPLHIGGRTSTNPLPLKGIIDEVRIWNTALTQSQIRDRMCQKMTSSDALYSNLVAYYNFDEASGNTVFDGTINANNGTLTNSPTRTISAAPIGNASSHDYVNAIKTTNISHPTGESFTVTSTSGNPDGIHMYRVDEQPNTLNGAIGVGANDKYFGVFQANGTAPQYTAVYNYNGNPWVNSGNENQLRLNKRADNAVASWTTIIATPNEPANTITITGESTEYILGKIGFALPVNLLSFTGSKQNTDVLLQWKTTNEINSSHFIIERSTNAVDFIQLGRVTAFNRPGVNDYTFIDLQPAKGINLYRLKQVDIDNRFTKSNIVRIKNLQDGTENISVFPNPVKDLITIEGLKQTGTILLYNAGGKLVQQQAIHTQTITMDMSRYAKGIYLLQYKTADEVVSQKIIKR